MSPKSNTADEEAIAALVSGQAAAWNAGDAMKFSEGFQDDGCFVNILGDLSYGRPAFETQHAKIFSTIYKGSGIRLPVRRIHFLRADVAIVDIDAELTGGLALPPGVHAAADGVLKTRLQEVLVKEEGVWQVASFHNVDVKGL